MRYNNYSCEWIIIYYIKFLLCYIIYTHSFNYINENCYRIFKVFNEKFYCFVVLLLILILFKTYLLIIIF